MTALIVSAHLSVPAIVAAAGDRAGMRFLEFFTANIRNPHTRRPMLEQLLCRQIGRLPPIEDECGDRYQDERESAANDR
jgi:hypothetical protein